MRLFLGLLLPLLAVADIVLTDSDLNLSNYNATTTYSSATSAMYGNCSSCGNGGGGGLQVIVDTPPSPGGGFFFGLIRTGLVWDPSTLGAIGFINASIDKNVTLDRSGNFNVFFEPLIEQGGNFYIALIQGSSFSGTTSMYQTISASGLMATDFGLYDFSQKTLDPGAGNPDFSMNPDFSAGGAPLMFGLAPLVGANDQFHIEADFSNFTLDVVSAAAVPEPAAMAPVAMLLGLLIRGRLRRN